MNKIEKIEKFVQDMRCEVADLKADASKKSFYTTYQSLVRSDAYLASIQDYIQKVKDEEEE